MIEITVYLKPQKMVVVVVGGLVSLETSTQSPHPLNMPLQCLVDFESVQQGVIVTKDHVLSSTFLMTLVRLNDEIVCCVVANVHSDRCALETLTITSDLDQW